MDPRILSKTQKEHLGKSPFKTVFPKCDLNTEPKEERGYIENKLIMSFIKMFI